MPLFKPQLNISNHFAQDCLISGVFNEIDKDLINLISLNKLNPKPLLICSGGTSSRCAANGHWTLDLREKYNHINVDRIKQKVEIEAGVNMGNLIKELSKTDNSFPIGLSGQTGMGYILSGGISPISRNNGLAIDQILNIKGFWGSGEILDICKPSISSSIEERNTWKGLTGAASFLAIVTSLELKIQKINPIYVYECFLSSNQLSEYIYQAESWPRTASLQWIWGERIKAYVVIELDQSINIQTAKKLISKLPCSREESSSIVYGIQELPKFGRNVYKHEKDSRTHSEVLGLLGPRWGFESLKLTKSLNKVMRNKPHQGCYVAAQQLGGATKNEHESSFIHRDSIWKPWITGSWSAGDLRGKEKTLTWMEEVWETFKPFCPGVHLAQMHQHLPWHKEEISAAFQNWLPELQNLKSRYDPNGILPPL